MNKYELTIIIPGKSTPAKQKAQVEKVEKFIKSLKGTIVKVDEWGRLDLSYKIEGNDSGVFFLFIVELNPADVKNLSDKLKTEDEVLRHLLIKV